MSISLHQSRFFKICRWYLPFLLVGCVSSPSDLGLSRLSLQDLPAVEAQPFNKTIEAALAKHSPVTSEPTPSVKTESKKTSTKIESIPSSIKKTIDENSLPSSPNVGTTASSSATLSTTMKLRFNAKLLDRNINIGKYTLSWTIMPNRYQVNTALVPSSWVKLFYSKSLREESVGNVSQGALSWQSYELHEVDNDASIPYTYELAERKGNYIKFAKQELPIVHPPMDIPSAFVTLMSIMSNPKTPEQWQAHYDLVTSRDRVSVTMKRLKDEPINVPAGSYQTRVVRATPDKANSKVFLQIWFDQSTSYPVSIIFSNHKGQKFLMDLEEILP